MARDLVQAAENLLQRPWRVFVICLCLSVGGIVVDGTGFRLWSLYREHALLSERIFATEARVQALNLRIANAQKPQFIERAARDQFDYVKDGDLIFEFGDAATAPLENSTEKSPDDAELRARTGL